MLFAFIVDANECTDIRDPSRSCSFSVARPLTTLKQSKRYRLDFWVEREIRLTAFTASFLSSDPGGIAT